MPGIYPEILDPEQQAVFKKLEAFRADGYLAGGTALALQIKHRKSYDFDIFLPASINDQFRKKVREVFGSSIEPRINTGDLFLVKLGSNVEVHFVHYRFDRLQNGIATESIELASVSDIAADKARTIGRRGAWRDYVDIFCLLKNQVVVLGELIRSAEKKFRGEFARHLFLEQLVYFKDFQLEPIAYLQHEYSPDEVKKFLVGEVEKFVQEEF